MILAAGLTPAWQHTLVFDDFELATVNRASEVYWCAAGKVLNVAKALHGLGGANRTIAPVGGGPGESIEREFASLGIPYRWVPSEVPTRICTTIVHRRPGKPQVTELVENAPSLGAGEYEEFLRIYAEEAAGARTVVMAGSLPEGTPENFYRDLMERTRGRVIVDARGGELLRALELEPYVVKPNRQELGLTLGRSIRTDGDLRQAMMELHRRGATWAVVSQGEGPLWISSSARGFYQIRPPRIWQLNPIGCGDCLAGAIAWGIESGRDVLESARLGVAAALESLQEVLPARVDRETVEALAEELDVEELS